MSVCPAPLLGTRCLSGASTLPSFSVATGTGRSRARLGRRPARWREMDSNHQYLEDKPRFVQRLRLRRVFDESVATATFFAPFGDHRPKLIRAMRHATRPTMCRSKVTPEASARSTIAPSRWLPARWARAQASSPSSRRPPRLRCDRERLANRLDSSERLCTSQLHAGNGRGRASTGIR